MGMTKVTTKVYSTATAKSLKVHQKSQTVEITFVFGCTNHDRLCNTIP